VASSIGAAPCDLGVLAELVPSWRPGPAAAPRTPNFVLHRVVGSRWNATNGDSNLSFFSESVLTPAAKFRGSRGQQGFAERGGPMASAVKFFGRGYG
jgi:hypothetical protein